MAALINYAVEIKMLSLHAERLADIALTAPEKDEAPAHDLAHLEPSIELRQVSFRYGEGEPWILRNVSLKLNAGENAAIVGPSGCGKTTLLKVLLAGSIADNICFFDVQPDMARVQACASIAAIHDDIAAMPMSYQTLVGDLGSSLSGGQKQRVLLARALYKRPKVLALDEATSHLDIANEQRVVQALAQMRLTRIVVAHRPETIASAQRVVAMQRGSVAEVALVR